MSGPDTVEVGYLTGLLHDARTHSEDIGGPDGPLSAALAEQATNQVRALTWAVRLVRAAQDLTHAHTPEAIGEHARRCRLLADDARQVADGVPDHEVRRRWTAKADSYQAAASVLAAIATLHEEEVQR